MDAPTLAGWLEEDLGLDVQATTAAVRVFMDRQSHAVVATELGMTPETAASLAVAGLQAIKAKIHPMLQR